MNLTTKLTKNFKVIWKFGNREYDTVCEMMASDAFGFMLEDTVYITVEGCRLDVCCRYHKYGAFIYTKTHEEAIKTAEDLAAHAPHCLEINLVVDHPREANPATEYLEALLKDE